jgi:hypothetical protein
MLNVKNIRTMETVEMSFLKAATKIKVKDKAVSVL